MFRFPTNADTEYYDALGVDKTASKSQIKKAYRKLAKQYHPDKVTDDNLKAEYTKKFQKIGEAYEVLSDDEKKQTYDQFGKEGVKGRGGANINPYDIFQSFFGNNGFSFNTNTTNSAYNSTTTTFNNSFAQKKVKKSAPVVHQVNIKLEDLFNGRIIKLKITKKTIFNQITDEPCDFHELENTWTTCYECHGNGVRMETRQLAPGFISKSQHSCRPCLGTGNVLKSEYDMRDREEIVEINIKRGMDIRHEHVIKGGGNCFPGTLPGDIIIAFHLEPHPSYQLVGNDLVITKKILLLESLCGFDTIIQQLDGTLVKIQTKTITTPGSTKTINGLGMYDKFGIRGKLVIYFEVEFPQTLTIHQRKNLRRFLPKPDNTTDNTDNTDNNEMDVITI